MSPKSLLCRAALSAAACSTSAALAQTLSFACITTIDAADPACRTIADSLSYSLTAHLLSAPVIIRPVDARARSVADDYFGTNTGSSRGGAAANHGMGFDFALGGSPLRPADGNAYSVATDPAAQRSANGRDERAVTTAVPEPSTYLLLLAGAGAVVFMARRRRDQY